MARALNWDKDRQRELTKRAIAQEHEEQRALRSLRSCDRKSIPRSKAADRELADAIARQHPIGRGTRDPRGAWHIHCDECGVSFDVTVALSVAVETQCQCPKCKKEHWLSEEDLKPPWE
jgi:hypothetical protein